LARSAGRAPTIRPIAIGHRDRHRRALLAADVEAEQAADWRSIHLDHLEVHPVVARVERKVIRALDVLVAGAEPGVLVAEDPGRCAVELELLLERVERALHAVSKASLPRASRIMQALLVAFDRRDFDVRVTEKNETFVTVLGEAFQIALVERFKQVTVKHTYGSRVDLEPSVRLMLRIGSSYHNAGVSDSTSRPIEDSLNRFVVNLVRRALEAKRERALHSERLERWGVQDEKNRLAQQQRESETLRRRRLRTAAVRWARHQRNVEFVNAVERRLRDGSVSPEKQENAERWLSWASERLKAIDPIGELLGDAWPSAPLRGPSAMPWNWD
jgi:hypothetical protein